MYNITVMDQYSSAIVTVPANMSSVEISQLSDNDTVVANREYTIIVSATSYQGTSYPSDPVVVVSKCSVSTLLYTIILLVSEMCIYAVQLNLNFTDTWVYC